VTAVGAAVALLGCAATVEDLRTRTIPNWLTGFGVAAGIACGWRAGGWRGALLAMGGTAAGFLIFTLFHCLGGLGGGDVKLMAAFGAMLGPRDILAAAAFAAIAGAVLACAATLWRRGAESIPYAPAIAVGAWLVFWARRS
jgi:prepilin peptidase CpaA